MDLAYSPPFSPVLSPDGAIATSGNYERFFITNGVRYHHIIDPQTAYPVKNEIASVSAITTNAMEADCYSTTLFLLGVRKGLSLANKNKIKAIFLLSTNIDNSKIKETNNLN